MRTQTHMRNQNPLKCSAYHEAGHAVVGIIRGLRLVVATIRPPGGADPHCKWDDGYIKSIIESRSSKERRVLTQRYAEMCLASRYSEAIACNTKSDEQRDSLHGDYLSLQWMRRKAGYDFFRLATVSKLNRRARTLVKHYTAAITAVAERLIVCATLNQAEIENTIKDHPASNS